MIDIWLALGLVASHVFAGAAPVIIYKTLKDKPNNIKLPVSDIPLMANECVNTSNGVFDVQGNIERSKVTVMSDDQYLKHLCKLYPEAYKTYKEKLSHKRIIGRADRYVMRMIIATENGDLDVELSTATMNFSNGDEVWIANKYYSYGNLYRSKDNPHCVFEISDATLSLYTFMRLVHLEETISDPVLRLKHSTIRVVSTND